VSGARYFSIYIFHFSFRLRQGATAPPGSSAAQRKAARNEK
jgi:hypothetical protein